MSRIGNMPVINGKLGFGCATRLARSTFVVSSTRWSIRFGSTENFCLYVGRTLKRTFSSTLYIHIYYIYTYKYISWHWFAIQALFTRRIEHKSKWVIDEINLCHSRIYTGKVKRTDKIEHEETLVHLMAPIGSRSEYCFLKLYMKCIITHVFFKFHQTNMPIPCMYSLNICPSIDLRSVHHYVHKFSTFVIFFVWRDLTYHCSVAKINGQTTTYTLLSREFVCLYFSANSFRSDIRDFYSTPRTSMQLVSYIHTCIHT